MVLLWRLLLQMLGGRILRLLMQSVGRLGEVRGWLRMVGAMRRVRLLLLRREVLLLLMAKRWRLIHETVLGRQRRLMQVRV